MASADHTKLFGIAVLRQHFIAVVPFLVRQLSYDVPWVCHRPVPGVVALPAEVRRRLHLDEPGAQVEITERDDGVLELRPSLPVPADQRWFWT